MSNTRDGARGGAERGAVTREGALAGGRAGTNLWHSEPMSNRTNGKKVYYKTEYKVYYKKIKVPLGVQNICVIFPV